MGRRNMVIEHPRILFFRLLIVRPYASHFHSLEVVEGLAFSFPPLPDTGDCLRSIRPRRQRCGGLSLNHRNESEERKMKKKRVPHSRLSEISAARPATPPRISPPQDRNRYARVGPPMSGISSGSFRAIR